MSYTDIYERVCVCLRDLLNKKKYQQNETKHVSHFSVST